VAQTSRLIRPGASDWEIEEFLSVHIEGMPGGKLAACTRAMLPQG
jgi:hypothetical protein